MESSDTVENLIYNVVHYQHLRRHWITIFSSVLGQSLAFSSGIIQSENNRWSRTETKQENSDVNFIKSHFHFLETIETKVTKLKLLIWIHSAEFCVNFALLSIPSITLSACSNFRSPCLTLLLVGLPVCHYRLPLATSSRIKHWPYNRPIIVLSNFMCSMPRPAYLVSFISIARDGFD